MAAMSLLLPKRLWTLILTCCCFALSTPLMAQSLGGSTLVNKGDNLLNIGIGIGRNYYGSFPFGASPSVTFTASFQHAIFGVGPGIVTLGGLVGYRRTYSNYYNNNSQRSWANIPIAIVTEYHHSWGMKRLDTYAGCHVGIRIETFPSSVSPPDLGESVGRVPTNYYGGTSGIFSLYVGGAYYLGPKVSLFGEAGFGLNWLNAGVSFRI